MLASLRTLCTIWLCALIFSVLFCNAHAGEQLICCGAAEVFVIPASGERSAEKDRTWRWQAPDSPEIPAALHKQFATTDDCKPCSDDRLLVTSSSGGVALLQRKDKRCLFYTSVKNAHSACLLPENRIAVASSTGGDELLVFSLERSDAKLAPLARLKLKGAHGAHWDRQRERLWALGTDELLLVEIKAGDDVTLVIEARYPLPTSGGHDLSPARDRRFLFVTSEESVYRFDTEKREFTEFTPLAKAVDIKSIDEHPTTGEVVYHQANHERKVWWSDMIRLLDPARTIQLPGQRLYKIRWDVVRE